ncbi:unnamed protein product [Clonostachys solani]|uniref:Actin-like ATPase domain-containing protein n=1 Tax=Clonostachys solani TaxID=160281 RepID=A0A9N9Z7M9_9HYPO|nr:unnamed protein product [Clonostachys solani]
MENQCIYGCAHGIIGLDFGSTYSAAAILLPSVDGYLTSEMRFVNNFPTSLHVIQADNGFELQFDPVDSTMLSKDRLCYLKALLMNQTHPRSGDNRMVNSIFNSWSGMDLPEEDVVVAIFLKGLFEKALAVARGLDAWHDGLRPAITITYPISWSPEELSMFQSAVRIAGIADHPCHTCHVRYITEHRAVVTTMQHEHYHALAELNGDYMIVADFGGMTDDAAVVPYPDSVPLRPPEEDELKSLDCRMLHNSSYTGSMSADAEFRTLLLQKWRAIAGDHEEVPSLDDANEAWERETKKTFTGLNSGYEQASFSVGQTRVLMRVGILKQIFDHSAEAKARLIEALFQQADILQHKVKAGNFSSLLRPSCIVLTGGLSLNFRLESQVEKKLRQRLETTLYFSKPSIGASHYLRCQRVTHDLHRRLAVCTGAVLWRLPHLLRRFINSQDA